MIVRRGTFFISPVVARLAKEHQLNWMKLAGTGFNGRITKKDLLAFVEGNPTAQPPASVIESASPLSFSEDEILHPLSTMRRAIAQHMVNSKQTSPHVTTIFEVDMTAVVLHREQAKTAIG